MLVIRARSCGLKLHQLAITLDSPTAPVTSLEESRKEVDLSRLVFWKKAGNSGAGTIGSRLRHKGGGGGGKKKRLAGVKNYWGFLFEKKMLDLVNATKQNMTEPNSKI